MRTIKRASLSKEEIVRRLRLADHYRYIRGRYGQQLPDDDAGREDLYELLLVISLAAGCYRKMKMAIQIWAGWMSKEEAEELVDRINLTPDYLRKRTARDMGERWRLTYEERRAWKIRTVAPCDLTEEEFLERRKGREQYMRFVRRRRAGKPTRAEWLATHSINRNKPWLLEGIGKTTWYQRRRTGVVGIKLVNTGAQPVQVEGVRGEGGTSGVGGKEKREKKNRVA